jgi:hypothetical protein
LIQIYDRHSYQDEMAAALTKLAALIKRRTAFRIRRADRSRT